MRSTPPSIDCVSLVLVPLIRATRPGSHWTWRSAATTVTAVQDHRCFHLGDIVDVAGSDESDGAAATVLTGSLGEGAIAIDYPQQRHRRQLLRTCLSRTFTHDLCSRRAGRVRSPSSRYSQSI